MLYALDLIGIALFAITGALAAGQRRMDIFGVLVLATVTAIGGGTIRDLLLQQPKIFWVEDPTYLIVIAMAAIATVLIKPLHLKPRRFLLIADALGLAFFTVLGAAKANAFGEGPIIVIVMGVLTGVAGGIIRDVLSSKVPLIFRSELYATASLLGAITFIITINLLNTESALTLGFLTAAAARLAAIHYKLSLPVFTVNWPDQDDTPDS